MGDYRVAGAADCIAAPVDIVSLNQTIQRIVRVRGRGRPVSSRAPNNFRFAGLGFYPGRNLLNGSAGNTIDLTTSEARLLTHFVSRPWAHCTRSEIGELLYGPEHSVGDRAIDVVVKAAEWYRQAAEQGVATAQLRLGFLYLSGEGVVRDPDARGWRGCAGRSRPATRRPKPLSACFMRAEKAAEGSGHDARCRRGVPLVLSGGRTRFGGSTALSG
jgi:hypothetical protein